MSDATGQLPHGLHLLGLAQLVVPLAELLLSPHLPAGVHRDPHHLLDDARIIKYRGEPGDEVRPAEVSPKDGMLPRQR